MGCISILCFPAFLFNQPGFTKDPKGRIRGAGGHTQVDNTVLMANGNENAEEVTRNTPKNRNSNISPKQFIREASSPRKTGSNVSLIREQFQNRGLLTTATEILEAAWRTGTQNQYEGYLGKWRQYCGEQCINPFSPTIEEGINFLTGLYKQGIGYSAINTARSCSSSCVIIDNNLIK